MVRCRSVKDGTLGALEVCCCSSWCRSCRALGGCRENARDECGSLASCGARCTKAMLVIVNFVFLICGVVFVSIGLMLYLDRESLIYVDLLHRMPSTGPLVVLEKLPSIFIGIGSSVVVLSFLGCYGACEESVCFLCMYTILLFLILGTEVVTGSLLTVFREKIALSLQSMMQYQIRHDYNRTAFPGNMTDPNVLQVTSNWDTMQVKLNCCGAVGPRDYKYSSWFNHTSFPEGVFVPASCCVLSNEDPKHPRPIDEDKCQIDAILDKGHSTALKTQGCRESAVKWLEANTNTVVVIAANVIIVQIVHFVFACSLLSRLRRSHSDYQWYEDNETG